MSPHRPLPSMPRPVLVNLESTLGCNLECVMCGSHLSGVTKLRRSMSPELVAQVEREVLPGVVDLALTVAGEPFMTPKLASFVALAERGGQRLQLNSNATLLRDSDLLRRILRQSSAVRFSVDGATAETYASIRGQADFDQVVANIAMASRVRAELPPAERPRLALCMVLMRRNVEELPAMVALAHRLGMDQLEVAHLTVLTPDMDAESLRHHPALCDRMLAEAQARADALGLRVVLPPAMQRPPPAPSPATRARLALQELRRLRPRQARRVARRGLHRVRLRLWELRAGGRVPCHFLQGGVFVTINGDVAPCPMPGRPIAGNLHERSFRDIWNGPVLTRMREGFLRGEPERCCAHCSQNPHGYDPADEATARPPQGSF